MQQNIKDLEILSQSFSPAQIFRYIYLLCMTFQFDKQCKVLQDMQSSQSGIQSWQVQDLTDLKYNGGWIHDAMIMGSWALGVGLWSYDHELISFGLFFMGKS